MRIIKAFVFNGYIRLSILLIEPLLLAETV